MSSIIIRHAAVYHPPDAVANQTYVEELKDKNEDVGGFLDALGRKSRYIGSNENSLTMAVKASVQLLEHAGLTGEDLDMIVFASATPEYLSPPVAAIIHHELKGKERCIAYDINVNCAGMIVALDQASRYMATSKVHRALVVGSEQLYRFSRKSDIITYPNFGDAACAVILEKVPVEGVGFIDSEYYTDSTLAFEIKNPSCGMSKIFDAAHEDELKIYWSPFDTDQAFKSAKESIERMLELHGYIKQDVKRYFMSQFSVKNIRDLSRALGEDIGKFKYIGDEFGYTGNTSPFIAFSKSLESHELNEGDVLVFWTVGAGVIACAIIYKYISGRMQK